MKWIGGVTLTLVAMLGTGWIFRAELVLFGVAQMRSAYVDIGPTIEIEWSAGADSQGRAPADRPANIVLIVADHWETGVPFHLGRCREGLGFTGDAEHITARRMNLRQHT